MGLNGRPPPPPEGRCRVWSFADVTSAVAAPVPLFFGLTTPLTVAPVSPGPDLPGGAVVPSVARHRGRV